MREHPQEPTPFHSKVAGSVERNKQMKIPLKDIEKKIAKSQMEKIQKMKR